MTENSVLPGSQLTIIPRRLLLVEDHESTARTLQRLLQRHGHEIWIALSCREALALAASHTFDALICDLDLPDGDGTFLLQKIRQTHPVQGIVLSGHGSPQDIERCRAAGFSAHLVKPFDVTEIEIVLAQILPVTAP